MSDTRDLTKELQLPGGIAATNALANLDSYFGVFDDQNHAFSFVPSALRKVGRFAAVYKDSNKRGITLYTWGKSEADAWVLNPFATDDSMDGPSTNPFANLITSGVKVLSQLVVNSKGHTTQIGARDLTAADIASIFIADGSISSLTQTWSAKKIYESIQQAVEDLSSGALIYKGEYNPITNTPNVTSDPMVMLGWTYVVSHEGTFLGTEVKAGDMIISKVDNPGNDPNNWQAVNKVIPAILQATETILGIVMLASVEEAVIGDDSEKAITPEGLLYALNNRFGTYTEQFGDELISSYTINHFLGTTDIQYTIRDQDGYVVDMEVLISDENNLVVSLNRPPRRHDFYIINVTAVLRPYPPTITLSPTPIIGL